MSQLTFDLDLEPATDTAFPTMQTAENGGKCSRCLRPLKGRYSLCHGACTGGGWFAWCDDCTTEKQRGRAA